MLALGKLPHTYPHLIAQSGRPKTRIQKEACPMKSELTTIGKRIKYRMLVLDMKRRAARREDVPLARRHQQLDARSQRAVHRRAAEPGARARVQPILAPDRRRR
jgi:hypothetical protein